MIGIFITFCHAVTAVLLAGSTVLFSIRTFISFDQVGIWKVFRGVTINGLLTILLFIISIAYTRTAF